MADDIDSTIARLHEAGATDDEITAIIKEKYGQQSSVGALPLAAAGEGVPLAANAAMRLATSQNVAKGGSLIGQLIGGVEGAMKGGPLGMAGGVWAGGKAGWHTGKLAQRVAAPIASGLEKVAPYAQALSTLGGVQGVNDLAQMAEPQRKDIGFLGMAPSQPDQPAPQMTPEQRALYDKTWQAKLGRLYGRMIR